MVADSLIEERGHLHLLARDRKINPSLDPVASIHKDVYETEGLPSAEPSLCSYPNRLSFKDIIPRHRRQVARAIPKARRLSDG